MAITIAQILDAVSNTLGTAAGIAANQHYNQLSEAIVDQPTLQVYIDEFGQDASGNNDRTTFKGGIRQTDHVIFADVYCQQRSHIGEDMAKVVTMADAVQIILEAQDTKPYFGLDGIKAFSWRAKRVVFSYSDPNEKYVGIRFTIRVLVF